MTISREETIRDLQTIPKWRKRHLWQPFMEKHDCQVICEIGVQTGRNFYLMIAHKPRIAVAVDAWVEDGNPAHNDSGFTQDVQETLYEHFKNSVAGNPAVQVCREYSHEAAKRFPDEYFDLVYIDADHTYEGCTQDIEDWYPKVKTGRFLTGDDYTDIRAKVTGIEFGVVKAVNDFAAKHGYEVYEMPLRGWAIIK